MWVRSIVAVIAAFTAVHAQPRVLFEDDFERGLDRWRVIGENGIRLKASGDAVRGMVLELAPNGDVAAIVRGSEKWGPVRMDGEMLFATGGDNYLGFVHGFNERRGRQDFGLVYLKGNENYLQANPHRDFNVSRLIYPELRTALTGQAAVGVKTWHRFAMEVQGGTAHIYVGDATVPQMTFQGFEFARGAIGLQPRSVGGPVWVDNIRVRALDRLSYTGPEVPSAAYAPESLLTSWRVAGPFVETDDTIARHPERASWLPFATDARGAVITGRVTDYHGARTVAYFRSAVDSARAGDTELQFSTIDDLAIWLNGEFQSFVARQDAAWFDFPANQAHAPRRVPVTMRAGINELIVRVRGGVYASGGFFSRVLPVP